MQKFCSSNLITNRQFYKPIIETAKNNLKIRKRTAFLLFQKFVRTNRYINNCNFITSNESNKNIRFSSAKYVEILSCCPLILKTNILATILVSTKLLRRFHA